MSRCKNCIHYRLCADYIDYIKKLPCCKNKKIEIDYNNECDHYIETSELDISNERVQKMGRFEKLAEILGVEIGEEFMLTCSKAKYRITNNKVEWRGGATEEWQATMLSVNQLLETMVKLPWQPKEDEEYYYPEFSEEQGYDRMTWGNDDIDKNIQKNVGVYKTKEEAIAKAKELGWVN